MEGDNYKWCLHTGACVLGAVWVRVRAHVCTHVSVCVRGEHVGIFLRSSRKEGNLQSTFRTEVLICLLHWYNVDPGFRDNAYKAKFHKR